MENIVFTSCLMFINLTTTQEFVARSECYPSTLLDCHLDLLSFEKGTEITHFITKWNKFQQ